MYTIIFFIYMYTIIITISSIYSGQYMLSFYFFIETPDN